MEIKKEILKYNTEHQLFVETEDESAKWFTYAQYYGHTHEMTDPIYLNAFSYFASIFLGGWGLSAGAEEFFQQKMEYDLIDEIGGFDFHKFSDEEKMKILEKIFKYMKTEAIKYEKVYSKHNCRLSDEMYEAFMKIKGDTYREKLRELMLHPQHTKFKTTSGKHAIRWNFTYTECKLWEMIDGENDKEKLLNIL